MNQPARRVILSAFGESPLEAIEQHLSIEEQPYPDTAELGPKDCIVAVKSASVGWVDLIMSSGQYQHMATLPYTPGLEYAGDVIWAGPEVDPGKIAVGDRVLSDGFVVGPRTSSPYQKWGGFASYAVAPMHGLHKIPARFSYDEACNLLGNYETAYHCLFKRGELKAGETVLILGASGATGLAAVHLAKIAGATVIATGRSEAKLAEVQKQGADHVLCTDDAHGGIASLRERIKAITGDRGVDAVYDGVGGDLSIEALKCLRFDGRFLIVGWAGTPAVAKGKGGRGAPNANMLPTNLIMMKSIRVLGCPAVISTQKDPSIRAPRLAAIMKWIEEGKLTPVVEKAFPLSEVKEAMLQKWQSRFVGGCVIHPNE